MPSNRGRAYNAFQIKKASISEAFLFGHYPNEEVLTALNLPSEAENQINVTQGHATESALMLQTAPHPPT